MMAEFYKHVFTGKESNDDLDCIVSNILDPEKIKGLRFVFVIKRGGEKTKKVDCYQWCGEWIRVNYIGNKRIQTREISFDELKKRSLKTMKLTRNLSYTITLTLTVYGNNE